MSGCPFEIKCSCSNGVWTVRSIVGTHNHIVEENLIGHSIARKPSQEEKEKIRLLGRSGVPPKAILSNIKAEFGNSLISATEIYNELNADRVERLNGKSAVECLLEQLNSEKFKSSVMESSDSVEAIFLRMLIQLNWHKDMTLSFSLIAPTRLISLECP